jgi:FkbM family methyltransferase
MSLLSLLRRKLVADLDSRLAPRFYGEFAADPIVIYDVGAAGGVYSPFPEGPTAWAPVIAFEPHAESHRHLQADGLPDHVTLFPFALADTDGPLTFYSGDESARTQSSLLPIDAIGLSGTPVTVDGMRLDSIPDGLGVPPANFLKLDTEGTEDRVLAGGNGMLSTHVLGMLVEISFWPGESGGVVFSQIDSALTAQGFVLFDLQVNRSDIRVMGGRKDKIRSGDALYLRNFETLGVEGTRANLLKLIGLAIAWRYLNYALELADYGRAHGLINEIEFDAIAAPLVATEDLSDRIPELPGRMALARLFDVLSYAFHPTFKKGVPHAFNGLGNHWVVRRSGHPPRQVRLYCPILRSGSQARWKSIAIDGRRANETRQ